MRRNPCLAVLPYANLPSRLHDKGTDPIGEYGLIDAAASIICTFKDKGTS
jgi:hypothetical protein